ncbi:hypothetical protein [Komagataeibacter sp. FNDCF1]|uniref:hypothetical protein n=1 Tax=Komagataeibacter sp. FNDCF1 TaxID=2878681 RepID=UPI001E6515A2|nr:hypothetical protein [Komagataeibacter sp. FNDCF1]MCE2565252.1 hypothetical protein [Komagataeibacter sp. FNDCF1]
MTVDVMVLLSRGRHPVSGRPRAARADVSALSLALDITATPRALHVGNPADPALRDYLGMGLPRLHVRGPADGDVEITPAILSFVQSPVPDLIICGDRAEQGECSGMVPYLLARALGCALVADVAAVECVRENAVTVIQAGRGGMRQRLHVAMPAVLMVAAAGPPPRQFAYDRARRGIIVPEPFAFATDQERAAWPSGPARARPPRLRAGGDARTGRANVVLQDPTPRQAAEAIRDFLKQNGIFRPP